MRFLKGVGDFVRSVVNPQTVKVVLLPAEHRCILELDT